MDLSQFVVENWPLFLALVVIVLLLGRSFLGSGGIKGVSTAEAIRLMNQDAVVVDVRTDKEYQEGHIMNSLHIPLGVIENRMSELKDYKTHSLIMVCRTGARSGQAAAKLKKLGFEKTYNLSGGMLAWASANLPTTTKKTKPVKAKKQKPVEQTSLDYSHEVVVYTTRKCPFCTRAIDLLNAKGVGFSEIRIDTDEEKRKEMEQRSSRTSVPQIFIGDFHVGDCDEMYALEDKQELDGLLGIKSKKKSSDHQESKS